MGDSYLRTVDLLSTAKDFLKYRFTAANAHDIHSPFVFGLLNNVIRDETPFYIFDAIEALRAKHLLNREKITVTDYGTLGGSKRELRISDIAKKHLKPPRYGQLLFRLANFFQSRNILELGTSLGITTMYLAAPDKSNKVITLEGCPERSKLALQNFERLRMNNIRLMTGPFEETLPVALTEMKRADMIYFDGNHRKEPTLAYFRECMPYHHEESVFIFDDIHWSRGMKEAWEIIKADERVALTIDLFRMGLVFFRGGIEKQHFVIRF